MKSQYLRSLAALFVTLLMLTQFNNCGAYTEFKPTESSGSSFSCTTANCVAPDIANLKITANLGPTGDYGVPAALSEFNIGGDCNEAGYPANIVRWELWYNGSVVRHSGMGVAAGAPANSRCINGRFLVYVNLAPLAAGDTVNRVGLANGVGGRSAYDLWIEVYGLKQAGDVLDPSVRNRFRVPLMAL